MKLWPWAVMALVGPTVGLAIELSSKESRLAAPTPFTEDFPASGRRMVTPAASTNTVSLALLPARDRFLEFATRPLFPRLPFRPQDSLDHGTLGLKVEYHDGQWVVSTPVGLGMSDQAARACLASIPHTLLTNLDLLEFSYRAMLLPQKLGGPGFTFHEAQQTALKLTINGKKWSRPKEVLSDEPGEPAWMGALRVPLEGGRIGAMPGAPLNDYSYSPIGLFDAFPTRGSRAGHEHHHCQHQSSGHHGSHGR